MAFEDKPGAIWDLAQASTEVAILVAGFQKQLVQVWIRNDVIWVPFLQGLTQFPLQ